MLHSCHHADRKLAVRDILEAFAAHEIVIPVQALAELYTVLTRKGRRPAATARAAVLGWHDSYLIVETSASVMLEAMEISINHQFALRDAIMLTVAAQTACRLLLSEDMQDGFQWRGVTIHNPFKSPTRAT